MKVSFNGVGEVCATFLGEGVSEGQPVKLTSAGTVAPCAEGERFCGVALCCRDGACTVQVRGFVTLPVTGDVPAIGFSDLTADGQGGVKSPASSEGCADCLIVDAGENTVTFLL